MVRDDEIDYDALDNISKKFDLVLQALDNQKAVIVENSITPALKALKHELEDPKDGLNDPYLNSLIAQLMKAQDDQYLVDDHIKTYLRTFIQELADELRDVYSKAKMMEGGILNPKQYLANKKIEHDEEAELESPPPIPEAEFVKKPESKKAVSGADKYKLVQKAYINLPPGTRTLGNLCKYIKNNYGVEINRATISYHCGRANLSLEGAGGSPSHEEKEVSEKNQET